MLNRYPLWKNLLVLGALLFGVIYALPNAYPPDFAVQISNERSEVAITQRELAVAVDSLAHAAVSYTSSELTSASGLIRFPTADDQLQGQAVIQRSLYDLSDTYIVALNSAPTTPDWLRQLGAEPMKYGLDLRGGVHFLSWCGPGSDHMLQSRTICSRLACQKEMHGQCDNAIILDQVLNGVAVRMSVLYLLLGSSEIEK